MSSSSSLIRRERGLALELKLPPALIAGQPGDGAVGVAGELEFEFEDGGEKVCVGVGLERDQVLAFGLEEELSP